MCWITWICGREFDLDALLRLYIRGSWRVWMRMEVKPGLAAKAQMLLPWVFVEDGIEAYV